MAIVPVGGPASLLALIRAQIAPRNTSRTRRTKALEQARKGDSTYEAQLSARLAAIPEDAPDRTTRTLHVLVECALLETFGDAARADARFPALVHKVTRTILDEPQLEALIEQACTVSRDSASENSKASR